ncbi:ABC transporter permease [Blattabacterium cuenoti]|uniref:ABC transporter permease n=1 Tax=Blattabacterium cuenoti TaxID=1653831 RepID=UPI00163BD5AD|nr:FtsX-like permease family protein [Blattabacterium cuenoti]
MNFEWFFSKKTVDKDCVKNSSLRTIVIIIQLTIIFSLVITILTLSVGFGFKEIIKKKFTNVIGHILIMKKSKKPFFLSHIEKKFLISNYIQIHGISEKNVIICTNNKIEKYLFKGVYEDYNPIFFKYFIIKGKFCSEKKSYLCNDNILLSKKISSLLGLNIGSYIKIYFFYPKNGSLISKKFKVSGIYETGFPTFDNIYIIGNIKSIQHIFGWKEFFSEKIEIFLSSLSYFNLKIIEKKIKKFFPNFFVKKIENRYNNKYFKWLKIFNINIFIIIIIIFFALIVNIIAFILILILERIKTIGILKILGAKNKVIYKIFFFYVIKIFIPSLLIGNSISIGLLIIQKKFHIISLNKIHYFIDFVPIYFQIWYILIINLVIIFICFLTIFFSVLFVFNKMETLEVINFE